MSEAKDDKRNEAADWVQSQLNWVHKRRPAKHAAIELDDFQRRAVNLLVRAMATGPWNLTIKWEKVEWRWGRGVAFVMYSGGLASFDFDHLTRLVILAHDECVRVEVIPCAPSYLRIAFHPRGGREGAMHERHPTLEQAIAKFRGVSEPVTADA